MLNFKFFLSRDPVQADQLTALYVPFCRDKSAADDLLTSHRSYFDVSS
jgi:hypothetical protein